MFTLIKINLRNLFSLSYFALLLTNLSIAWFLSNLELAKLSYQNGFKIIETYEFILNTFLLIMYLYICIGHFYKEFTHKSILLFRARLNSSIIFWGMIISYIIYYAIGVILPTYLTAFLQHYIYVRPDINSMVYLYKYINNIFSFVFLWLILSIWFTIKFKDLFSVLVVITLLILVSQLLFQISSGLLFDHNWFYYTLVGVIDFMKISLWILAMVLVILLGKNIAFNLKEKNFYQQSHVNLYSKIAQRLSFDLLRLHIQMIGNYHHKILFFFSFLGLCLVISVISIPNANLSILAKVYIGAFVPLLFSLNYFNILKIDIHANMMHSILIRKTEYWIIVFNRWLVELIPQTIVILVYLIILKFTTNFISIELALYIVFLSLMISSFSLLTSLIFRRNSISNIVIFFLVYLQLRDDTQNLFLKIKYLQKFNLFRHILQNNSNIENLDWVLICIIPLLVLLICYTILRETDFASFEFS